MSGRCFWTASGSSIALDGFQNSWFFDLKIKPPQITTNLTLGAKGLQNRSQNDPKWWPGTYLFLNMRNLDFVRPYMVFAWFSPFQGSRNPWKIAKKSHLQITYLKSHIIYVHCRKIIKKWKRKWGCKGPGNSLFSDLGAMRLHFSPQIVLELHLEAQWRPNEVKWSPNGSQTTQNGTRIKI